MVGAMVVLSVVLMVAQMVEGKVVQMVALLDNLQAA